MQLNVRDPSDALWIAGTISHAQLAVRAAETGAIQEFRNLGWAMLCDKVGIVWMGGIEDESGTQLNRWRDGEMYGQVTIPHGPGWLFSDREGSVYAWTRSGLYHLTASASSGFSDYAVAESYLPPAVPGNIVQFAYSEQGFIVLRTYTDSVPRLYHVVIIPIPTPE